MFASHPTIVALHANSFCKYLKLLAGEFSLPLSRGRVNHVTSSNHVVYPLERLVDFFAENFSRKTFRRKFDEEDFFQK